MSGIDLTGLNWDEINSRPAPSNQSLRQAFSDARKIIVKDDGVSNGQAMSDEILLTVSDAARIAEFLRLLQIDEAQIGFHCMCLGTYALEIYDQNEILATIGMHHGQSIRWESWNSDAALAKSDELAAFLYEEGLEAPLLDKIAERKRIREREIVESDWLSVAPACFVKYWTEMNDFDESYLPSLIDDFKRELSDKNLQITKLLRTYGNSGNLWTAYPMYEKVPFLLLKTYDLEEIISAYQISNKNSLLRRGLGRFLGAFEFRKTRKKWLGKIPQTVIDELKDGFEASGDAESAAVIDRLAAEKASK